MTTYGAESIQVLEGLEPVRQRPGMYIGSTGPTGLHHLVWEVVDNSIDEAMAGYCTDIIIEHGSDGSITVTDNGRGIPVGIHPTEGIPAVQVVLTKLHAGGKFDEKVYGASGGLHGVGLSAVNALAGKLVVTVWRDGKEYQQTYCKGVPVTELSETIAIRKTSSTRIQFYPDPTIFETIEFDDTIIKTRLRELSYLNPGLAIKFIDPKGKENVFESENGLVDYVNSINPDASIQPDTIELNGNVGDIYCYIAMRWTKSPKEEIRSFCNNITTAEGGTHLTGFKAGLSKAVANFLLPAFLPKNLEQPSSEDIREGLVAIVSVRVPQPQFEGQTKGKLGTSAALGAVNSVVYQKLQEYFSDLKKEQLKCIAERIINSTKARVAAQRARENARKSADLGGDSLPGKLTDCQSQDPAERELYLVEGASAGGSAKQGRDRKFQAILPLKGKILNTERAAMKTILGNAEVQTIIASLGTGIGAATFDLEKLRYHKIIIMCDSDVDGCLGGDTKVKLLDGTYKTMEELSKLYPNESSKFWVWANDGNGRQVPAIAHSARITKHVDKIYEVELDNGAIIQATENHPFMLRTGAFARASELKSGQSLMWMSWRVNGKGEYNHKVKSVRLIHLAESIPVYDLAVDIHHNFLICAGKDTGVFVHNSHIRTLLLTFFFRHMPEIILNGNLYAARPPLFRVKAGKTVAWVYYEEQLQGVLETFKEQGLKPAISRFKGLGEMPPEMLWKTTMDPENRILTQIEITDENCDEMFQILMGDDPEKRAAFIHENAEMASIDI